MIEQVLNQLTAAGQSFQACYLRTSDQFEIALLLELSRERWAIKVKSLPPNLALPT